MSDAVSPFEPKRPSLLATGFLSLWIAVLCLPMWAGRFLASPVSDQYKAGFGFRTWAAEQWKTTGRVPLWNPEIFGGMPFVAGMHGDIFYPTAWLRLVLPIDVAMNLGFAVHYVLAGLFAYLLLRRLGISWAGSVAGGLAYQLTGVVASYVNPGHDGKLFVTALFPLALLGLVMALRERKWEGHALLALAVGLGFLSPHPQLLYYMLVASGLFALYLTFGEPSDDPVGPRITRLTISFAAVMVGFGIGAIQMVPFYYYIPYSPRAETIGGWERATSFAIPWEHVPEFLFSRFAGEGTINGNTYWGGNGIKFHSEYLGLPVVALAILGALGTGQRRLKLWLAGIAGLFMLVAMGSATPFYRIWYTVMPFMKQVRAAGMAFYLVAFVIAVFAALGIDRLMRGEGKNHVQIWLGAAVAVALLAVTGALGAFAESLSSFVEARVQVPRVQAAMAASSSIRLGALTSAMALGATAAIAWALLTSRLSARAATFLLLAVIGTDLWLNARTFWNYTDAPDSLFAGDAITEYLQDQEPPYRTLNIQVYPPLNSQGTVLMAYGIPELLGHHGNELHAFDELLGGKDVWANLPFYGRADFKLLDMYGTRYIIAPVEADTIPGFRRILTNVVTAGGRSAHLFERDHPVPYARIVAGIAKIPDEQIVPTVMDARFPIDRVVLLDSSAPLDPGEFTEIPDSLAATVSVTDWAPGRIEVEITPPAPEDAFVVLGENWYFEWRAMVDGRPAETMRANGALLGVPVPAGTRHVSLRIESPAYQMGKRIMLVSILIVAGGFVVPATIRRRSRG